MSCDSCEHCRKRERTAERMDMGAFMARLCGLVSQEYGVETTDMTSVLRTQHVSSARMVAYYLSRELTSLSWKAIGEYFNKDHSTIVAGHKHTKRLMKEKPLFAVKIRGLMGVMAIKREAA